LVEHRLCKAGVRGSIPLVSTSFNVGTRKLVSTSFNRCIN
jgi:hypothetical protein